MLRPVLGTACATAATRLAATAFAPDSRGEAIAAPMPAAFHACPGAPVSVGERLDALGAGGWTIAGDRAAEGDPLAQGFAAGWTGPWAPGERSARDAAVEGGSARPLVSRVQAGPEDDDPSAVLPGRAMPDAAAVAEFIGQGGGGAVLYYVAPGSAGAPKLLVVPHDPTPSSYFVTCNLYASSSLTEAEFEGLLPDELRPADLRRERRRTPHETHAVSYAATLGHQGEATYVDASGSPGLRRHLSRVPATVALAGVVTFEAPNLPLTD